MKASSYRKPPEVEVWELNTLWPLHPWIRKKPTFTLSVNSLQDYGVIMNCTQALLALLHTSTTWQETDPHRHTHMSSGVQWATSVERSWLQLTAAQPSPVLTCRIAVSLPEEAQASFTFSLGSESRCVWPQRQGLCYMLLPIWDDPLRWIAWTGSSDAALESHQMKSCVSSAGQVGFVTVLLLLL